MNVILKRPVRVFLFVFIMAICLSIKVEAKTPKLNHAKANICIGKKLKLKVSGTSNKVTWSSTKKKVVKVSRKGVIKGLKKGTATITAKVGSKKLTCKVKVKSAISPIRVTLTVKNANGIGLDYRSDSITAKSKNPEVATVEVLDEGYDAEVYCNSADIMVYGHKNGKTKIILTNNCNKEKRVLNVVVNKPEATTGYQKLVDYLLLHGVPDDIGDKSIVKEGEDAVTRILYDPMADEIHYEYEETNDFGNVKWLLMPTEKENTERYVVMWLYPENSKEEYYVTATIDSATYQGETIVFEKGWYREPAEEVLQPVANEASQRAFQSIGILLKENTGMDWKEVGFSGLS